MDNIKAEIQFIDLGLPSGTKWADRNLPGFYTFDEACEKDAPTAVQMAELYEHCEWEWDEEKKGYTVTGQNGNSIFLPADGYCSCGDDEPTCVGSEGRYWTKCPSKTSQTFARYLYFGSGYVSPLDSYYRSYGFSVRPVQEKYKETLIMAHLIDANKLSSILKAQIQEREDWMNDTKNYEIDRQKQLWSDLNNEDRIILSLVNSLKQEQPEEDIEKEIDKWAGIYRDDEGNARDIKDGELVYDWRKDDAQCMNTDAYICFARHFYELGFNARKEE